MYRGVPQYFLSKFQETNSSQRNVFIFRKYEGNFLKQTRKMKVTIPNFPCTPQNMKQCYEMYLVSNPGNQSDKSPHGFVKRCLSDKKRPKTQKYVPIKISSRQGLR